MGKIKAIWLFSLAALLLSSCNFGTTNPGVLAVTPLATTTGTVGAPVVRLIVQAVNAGQVFNTAGQIINYSYAVTNTGIVPLNGPVFIVDDKATVTCPSVNTVGNLDNSLDPNESITCTSSYSITQADLTVGSVTNRSTATVGGTSSSQVSTTVSFTSQTASALKLTKSASPLTFNQVGQIITYSYSIQNIGAAAIGPVQFTITDNKIASPFNCGAAATTLAPQQIVTCTATYAIVQADLTAGTVTNSATASGGGTNISAPATTTITASTTGSNFTRGSTIQHTVIKDEWMIQLARCYGASFEAVRNANLQVIDPDIIDIGMILSIPNIGSNGNIYGPPCVGYHTVVSGDTWDSIARRYNADVVVLQAANRGGMAVGTVLKIPLNSAGATVPVTGVTGTPPTATLTPTTTLTPTVTLTPTATLTPTPTPGTVTPSPTGTITAEGTPITFPPGGSSATQSGTLPAQGTARYAFTASQGQVVTVRVTAPMNEVTVRIFDPAGNPLNPLNTTLTLTLPLPASGTYRIEITSIVGTTDKAYTLDVSLATPTPTTQP